MPNTLSAFVAYASELPGHGDAIEAAIRNLNQDSRFDIRSWRSLPIQGRLIIDEVCKAISERDVFIPDLTILNQNVLFEYGYAIAKRRKIWPLYNPKVKTASSDSELFGILNTTGHTRYLNNEDIEAGCKDLPGHPDREPLLDSFMKSVVTHVEKPQLLYIKPDVSTQAVSDLTRRIMAGPIPALVDDPEEVRSQPLAWYVQQVALSFAVVCHFLSSTAFNDVQFSNAKNALVAGIAYGLGKPLLMLAHEPYLSPLDYRDILKTHADSDQALARYDQWLHPLIADFNRAALKSASVQTSPTPRHHLLNLYIGDPVAEYEQRTLVDYFVDTAAYVETLRSDVSLFLGRKGSGKTATMIRIAEELQADARNHVCAIRPAAYELNGLVAILDDQLSLSDQGYLVESFWKFLIYTELARGLYERITARGVYYTKKQAEEDLIGFVGRNSQIIAPEFSSRLVAAVNGLLSLSSVPASGKKTRISEALHTEMLAHLNAVIGPCFKDCPTVAVLIDNLDKTWTANSNLALAGQLLLGLLGAASKISDEFRRTSSRMRAVESKIVVFLRSDIHDAISKAAPERDKLPIRKVNWEDRELLVRVIEERFIYASSKRKLSPEEIWSTFFTPEVQGMSSRDFILQSVFPRPRDLIYLVKASLQHAINRAHPIIEASDILSAVKEYSGFACNSLIVEMVPHLARFEDVLNGMIGMPFIMTDFELLQILDFEGIECDFGALTTMLCELAFFGIEVAENEFSYIYDQADSTRILGRSRAFRSTGRDTRFSIHPVYRTFLDSIPAR